MTTISWTFQSTLPTRGSDDICRKEAAKDKKFQSTLPTRGSDAHKYYDGASPCEFQSTLPTRGSDCHIRRWIYQVLVSIHAPHEGERPIRDGFSREEFVFQSTLPTRGSDQAPTSMPMCRLRFNPRSPRGGATEGRLYAEGKLAVSIHAPHEGERLMV